MSICGQLGFCLLALTTAACQRPADNTYSQLLSEIRGIPAIDNHAHPVRPTSAAGSGKDQPDREFDALPVDNLEPASDPIRTRPAAPEITNARTRVVHGDPAKVLDQLGIGIMLANRVAMGPPGGTPLPSDRFLWVPYADALMYPLDNTSMATNPDRKAFFALEENLLKRYYTESGVSPSIHGTLDEYLNKVVRPTLQRQKQGGAVAEKFEMAYLRSLDIGNPTKAEAEAAWAGHGPYKALQDYIFRQIAAECGRLGMAVHFHTGAGGGSYFDVTGSNPMLLEPLLNDPSLRHTNFVFLHGGWPFEHQLAALLMKPNAYADFSAQNLFLYPAELAKTIRAWLEYVPEKVLFATDAYPYSADEGWEESGYIAASTGREALAAALTGMLHDGEINRARASELARMVLRDNARALYHLK